jgi:transcriptional regulator with XRE-family HTH domain
MLMAPRKKLSSNPSGRRLASLRRTLDMTQAAMAAKLGISFRMYQYYEAGQPLPKTVSILVRLIEEGKY